MSKTLVLPDYNLLKIFHLCLMSVFDFKKFQTILGQLKSGVDFRASHSHVPYLDRKYYLHTLYIISDYISMAYVGDGDSISSMFSDLFLTYEV